MEMNKKTLAPRLLREADAAAYLGVSVASLRLARSEGHRGRRMALPPPVRLGRAVRYCVEDLDALIDALKAEAAGNGS